MNDHAQASEPQRPEDTFDAELRRAARGRAADTRVPPLDIDRVGDRARALTRRRRQSLVGVCVALAVGGIAYAVDTSGGTTGSDVATEGSIPGRPKSSLPPTTGSTSAAENPILAQLQSSRTVREHLLGTPDAKDLVLCGMQELGRSQSDVVYVWLYCGSYTTGPDAENVSGGADPAVVSLEGSGASIRVTEVAFPPMGNQPEDIRRLFPDVIADRILAGNLAFNPTEAELLDQARAG